MRLSTWRSTTLSLMGLGFIFTMFLGGVADDILLPAGRDRRLAQSTIEAQCIISNALNTAMAA